MVLQIITSTLVVLLIAAVAILAYSLNKAKSQIINLQMQKSNDWLFPLVALLLFSGPSHFSNPIDLEFIKKMTEKQEKKEE